MSELFRIEDLHAKPTEAETQILRGISLTVNTGEVHAIMGPNGSGKSTLATTLLGAPEYEVTHGRLFYKGEDISLWPTDVRAKAGIFLAFQYPQEIAGVSVIQFLRQSLSARKGIDLSVLELRLAIISWMKRLGMDSSSRTSEIMLPPPKNGGMASSSSLRPHNTPRPDGPHIL